MGIILGRRGVVAAVVLPVLSRPAGAAADDRAPWPTRPVRMVVPFPAGSTPDVVARVVCARLSLALGQPVVADNRVGAGGNLGTEAVARATDGHTVGVSINGPLATAPALFPALGYDPARDLAPVSLLARAGQVLAVHPSIPGDGLAAFVAHARANAGALSFGSVGAGSGGHLAMEAFMAEAGLSMVHVPYRGFPQAVVDLVAGRIQAMFLTAAGILPQVAAGQVRAVAVSAAARIPQAPEVPTLAEAGWPGMESYAWVGMIAPIGTPTVRVALLASEARRALEEPSSRAGLEKAGFEIIASTPEEFGRYRADEAARWGGMIRRLGIRGDA